MHAYDGLVKTQMRLEGIPSALPLLRDKLLPAILAQDVSLFVSFLCLLCCMIGVFCVCKWAVRPLLRHKLLPAILAQDVSVFVSLVCMVCAALTTAVFCGARVCARKWAFSPRFRCAISCLRET